MLPKTIFATLFLSVLITLASTNEGFHGPWKWNEELPSGIQIDTNLYIDQFEHTNFNWLEYMFWTARIFGDTSAEYKSTIPDSKLWLEENYCIDDYGIDELYLRHVIYRNYPVVCITQQQAEAFCKWRSDRVFEYLLIREEVFEYNMDQTPTNYFSVENYFEGNYFDMEPNMQFNYYPEYRLPSLEEWNRAIEYLLNYCNGMKRKQKKCPTNLHLQIDACTDSLDVEPILAVDYGFVGEPFGHLYDNVSEWLSEPDKIIGGSWKDSLNVNLQGIRDFNSAAVWIGFRGAASWVKYEKAD